VANIAPRVAEEVSQSGEGSIRCGCSECVAGMMPVLVADVTVHAQIVVFAGEASDELLLREARHTAVTGASWLLVACARLLLVCEGSRDVLSLLGLGLGLDHLGWDALGGAVDDAAVLNEALDHPVTSARAVNAGVNTCGTEIVIATVTDAAVEVFVFHGVVAVVAVDNPGGAGVVRLRAERKIGIVRSIREVGEEA
jgi:hypothetical protein